MSTQPPNPSWPSFERTKTVPSTPRTTPIYATPEIRDLERQVVAIDMAQTAHKNANVDVPIGVTNKTDALGNTSTHVVTKRGHLFAFAAGYDDWLELPPVPGTRARMWYDERKKLTDEIDRQNAEMGVRTDG